MTAKNAPIRTHTLAELQAILSDQIDRIATDRTTPAKVNAVVNATATILRTVKMQMDYAETGRPDAHPSRSS